MCICYTDRRQLNISVSVRCANVTYLFFHFGPLVVVALELYTMQEERQLYIVHPLS